MTDTLEPTADRRRPHANPYLAGNHAPVAEEVTAFDLPVVGELPAELEGRWLRNGPNPEPGDVVDETKHHWFMGTGMVHGVRLRGGRAEWYRNRFVLDPDARRRGEIGPNTNVGGFAGRTWAMVEAGLPPAELTYDLAACGPNPFDGTLGGPFTAHPKYDPATGELHTIAYHWPDLVDHVNHTVVGPDGRVVSETPIHVPDMPMIHDMSLTERYVVVYDLSVVVDLDVLAAGYTFPFRWNDDRPCRVGLLPRAARNETRSATGDDVIWCDVDPCYVFHPMNAFDAPDGTVVVDVCRYDSMMADDRLGPFGDSLPTLDRWVIDPVARRVTETRLDDRPQEFPRHDPRVGLREYRWGYTSTIDPAAASLHGDLLKIDVTNGSTTAHRFGHGRGGAEPVVVPKAGGTDSDGGEDASWILSVVYDATTDSSELHVIDAEDFAGDAVAVVELPQRVPFGFHGNWVPDTSVAPS